METNDTLFSSSTLRVQVLYPSSSIHETNRAGRRKLGLGILTSHRAPFHAELVLLLAFWGRHVCASPKERNDCFWPSLPFA